jgi:tetratricopeptide (TPR) repeat protein
MHPLGKSLLVALLLAVFAPLAGLSAAAVEDPGDELDRRIARLIEQLGNNEYTVRERAQQELIKLGFTAFDALSEAEENSDLEISDQAGYLVRLIRVDWTRETDPPQVRQIMKDYEFQQEGARLQRMKDLAGLVGDEGVEWLCRLARFEQSQVLSKQAAMIIMGMPALDSPAAQAARMKVITRSLERSTRPAARWLKAYVSSESKPDDAVATWEKLIDAEQQTLEQSPQQTSPQIVSDLLRRHVALLDRLNRPEDALNAIRKMVRLERGDSTSLAELVEWVAKRKAWPIIDEIAAKFAGSFDGDAILLYTLAQARLEQGDEKLADEIAKKALTLHAENAREHMFMGYRLHDRGLAKFSELEYRKAIELGPASSDVAIRSRFLLSENLHDAQNDLAAGEILKGAVDLIDGDEAVKRIVAQLDRTPEAIRSRMYFFFGAHYGRSGDHLNEAESYRKAIAQDPSDADVLIGLYRLPGQTPQQRQTILEQIAEAVRQCRADIEENPEASNPYNQFAWLVANTEGDFDEAVRMSLRSIEIRRAEVSNSAEAPNVGGYLDTLAHCYYAKRDYASAVRYQTEAVASEPHSQAIARQLIVFRKALADQQKSEEEKK